MTADTLTFGCEFELATCPRNWREAVAREFGQADAGRWEAKYDGSLRGRNPQEVVTPPLHLADLPALQRVIRAWRAAGARVNESCGGHIHVGQHYQGGNRTVADVLATASAWARMQDVIYPLTTCEARRGRYCNKWAPFACQAAIEAEAAGDDAAAVALFAAVAERGADIDETLDGETLRHYTQCRYKAVNLANLVGARARKTIEFRLFDGTLNAKRLAANVRLALALCDNDIVYQDWPESGMFATAEEALQWLGLPAEDRAELLVGPRFGVINNNNARAC